MAMKKSLLGALIISIIPFGCNNPSDIAKNRANESTYTMPVTSPSVNTSPSPLPIQSTASPLNPSASPTCSSPWNFTPNDLEWKIPEDRYVFIEDVIDWYTENSTEDLVSIDYSFYKSVGLLQGGDFDVDKNLKAIWGDSVFRRGGWNEQSSNLSSIINYNGIVKKADINGTVYLYLNCTRVTLKPGQEYKYVVEGKDWNEKFTHTITNYGILRKSKIRNHGENNYYFYAPEIKPDFPPSLSQKMETALIPKGEKIAFYSNREGSSSIYAMKPDGSNTIKLVNIDYQLFKKSPSWSPEGTKLAFAKDNEIYTLDSDGNLKKITDRSGKKKLYTSTSWSPDAKTIAFTEINNDFQDANNNINLITEGQNTQIKIDYTNISEYMRFSSFVNTPAWSPDGSKIFFQKCLIDNELSEIYSMNADGSNQVKLTDDLCFTPVCSPDGKKIALATYRDGNYEIYTMNTDGTDMVNLTKNPANDAGPSYSHDGKKIAFFSNRDGNWEIYIMNSDGSDQKRITNNPASDMYPAWSR